MTSDQTAALAAARRLAESLPSRTHLFMNLEPPIPGPRGVTIDGREFPSLRQAARAHGVSIGAVVKWIDNGKASCVP